MKAVLMPFNFIVNQSMASNFTSQVITIVESDTVSIQLNYSGSPSGSFAVNVSLDGINYSTLYLTLNGTTTTNAIAVPTYTSPIFLDIDLCGAKYLTVSWAGSGSGTCNGFIAYKRIGD